jgi:hypothetical protein
MAGRPPIDLNQKVRDLLTHTVPLRPGVGAPIRNFEERTNACFNLIKYIDDHVSTQSVYRASYDRHMSLLDRMVLVNRTIRRYSLLRHLPTRFLKAPNNR